MPKAERVIGGGAAGWGAGREVWDLHLPWPATLDRTPGARGETIVVLASHDSLLGIHGVAHGGPTLRGRAGSRVRTVLWNYRLSPGAPVTA